jgi:electron transport complex protein RnfG
MVIILTLIASLSGIILSFVHSSTKEKIAEAYRQEFLRALVKVLPKYDNEPDKDIKTVKDRTIYVAKYKGEVVGYAILSTSTKGYGGDIDVLVGVSPSGKILGIEILRHAETPGLGNKIENEEFKNKFKGLDLNDKIAVKKDGGMIDQFSGATISPRAVAEAVDLGLKFISDNLLEK